jgi:hypothetical protein
LNTPGQTPLAAETTSVDGDIRTGLEAEISRGEAQKGADEKAEDPQAAKPPRKPKLTDEQQLWLNKVFIPNFRRELMKNLKPEDLMSEHERRKYRGLKDTVSGMVRNDLERRGEYEQVLKKKDQAFDEMKRSAEEERERLLKIITETKVDKELISAASRYNSVNPSQVAQLLRRSVRLDDDLKPVVLDEERERAVNAEGKFMTIDEKVRLFLDENPHMVKPSGTVSGSGASDSLAGRASVTAMTGGDLIGEGLRAEKKAPAVSKR